MSETSPTRAFRAVLLDVDGTLIDTIPMIVAGLGDAFEKFLGTRPDEPTLRALIGTPLTHQMQLFGLDQHQTTTLEERVRHTMDRYVAHKDKIRTFSGAERAYRRLVEAGVPTALVTSRNREELEWILGEFPLFQSTLVRVSASDVERPKPAPDPVWLACRQLNLATEEVCFIGDSVHDVESAHAAGCAAIAVCYGGSDAEPLRQLNPDVLLETPDDLDAWVSQTRFQTSSTCFSTTANASTSSPSPASKR